MPACRQFETPETVETDEAISQRSLCSLTIMARTKATVKKDSSKTTRAAQQAHKSSTPSKKKGAALPHRKPGRPRKVKPHRLTAATNTSPPDFLVHGTNEEALFTLAAYRGEGMCLLAMNWKDNAQPPNNFVGFGIDYKEPNGTQFFALNNRLSFPASVAHTGPNAQSSHLSPIQKFRWVHFPLHADLPGFFTYRVMPVFMDITDGNKLSYGDVQQVQIELQAETYPGELNVAFTRGFISSQAFIDNFGSGEGSVSAILPATANAGLTFQPAKKEAAKEEAALAWMGFEARTVILGALDAAIADATAQVRVCAYDFNDPEIVSRIQQLKSRVKIIIDDSGTHKSATSAESQVAGMIEAAAGAENVQRQHMGDLQHNKSIVVDGEKTKIAIGGSTNFSWRGLYVQNNNTVSLQGEQAVKIFSDAFDNFWANPNNPTSFEKTISSTWTDLGFKNINAQVTFSPHNTKNAALNDIASDISTTTSSLFYSLAFLYETPGVIRDAIEHTTAKDGILVYGLSDKSVGGLDIQQPDGNPPIAFPASLLQADLPPPFKAEATGGFGTRLHHKFVVVDFNKPGAARVYTGSHNFSVAADTKNAENLFCIRDQRVATSYMIEAVAMFDHYSFRDAASKSSAKKDQAGGGQSLQLSVPPAEGSSEKPWWDKYWTVPEKEHDRVLFGI
ncbi:hypothetical protein N0V82_003891 [Gnomoniopsis sp. IMI 355080]|nr:hypothetical protein N0V82_003891 [Gnomoniopsis sp. IMI 355080]